MKNSVNLLRSAKVTLLALILTLGIFTSPSRAEVAPPSQRVESSETPDPGKNYSQQTPKSSNESNPREEFSLSCAAAIEESKKTSKALSCVERSKPSETSSKSEIRQQSDALGAGQPGFVPWCDNSGVSQTNRFEGCAVATTPITVGVVRDGQLIGRAMFGQRGEIKLYPTETGFVQGHNVIPFEIDESLKAINLSIDFICAGRCRTYVPAWSGDPSWIAGDSHPARATVIHGWDNSATPNTWDNLMLGWKYTFTFGIDAPPVEMTFYDQMFDVRCDNQVGNSAGCAFSRYTPTFPIGREYPASRALYRWAQWQWGYGDPAKNMPLHRQADAAIQNSQRYKMCRNGTFSPHPDTPSTTCDEFPFAASRESGGSGSAASGQECRQFYAYPWPESPNGWGLAFDNRVLSSDSKPCVRGNIPEDQNENPGRELGRFTQDVRLLDADPYWIDAGLMPEMMQVLHAASPQAFDEPSIETTNANSDLCLGIYGGSGQAGEQAIQWECNGNPDQKWSYRNSPGTREYEIKVDSTGMCLAVSESSMEWGHSVIQWPCAGSPEQRWIVKPIFGTFNYQIVNKNSNQCLAVWQASTEQGAKVVQWPCGQNPDHMWK